MVFPWESLVGSHLAFIPCQTHELLSGAALHLPRARSVIDIPASMPCNADVILAVRELKKAGYRLALTGWNANKERRPSPLFVTSCAPMSARFRQPTALKSPMDFPTNRPPWSRKT
jgi:c-di-GMP-related signal transduction protein